MKFDAIAWDIDGTLVDSEPLHHRALLAACRRFGLDLSALPASRFCGVHVFDVWQALRAELPADLPREVWLRAIEDHYHAHSSELDAIPDSRETIRLLAAKGIKQACVSNSCRAIVESNLRALGVRECMDVVVTLDDVNRGKPAPEPYQHALSALGLPAAAVLAVEDSQTGALSAQAAGMHVAFYGALPSSAQGVTAILSLTHVLDWF
ncbi:HAD superfamily hydrolase [Sodalis praecaptivus]|uniref:HAD superfamily hydrolase n=1 Tax=Sodalis praecaptivus TaxID=1239307 RepID=W0HS70_9GAMM|nr:HAD family phosphatase [Sodalis praecaptivus]AHF76676.1 HAD superfamily hydrolase [Sodalis praecaptivus]